MLPEAVRSLVRVMGYNWLQCFYVVGVAKPKSFRWVFSFVHKCFCQIEKALVHPDEQLGGGNVFNVFPRTFNGEGYIDHEVFHCSVI